MNKYKVASPVLMWLVVIIGAFILIVSTPDGRFFERNIFTTIVAVAAAGYWIYFLNAALKVNRQAIYSADKVENIIQEGVYGIIRHPIYAADIVLFWGIFLHWPLLRVFMCALWATLMLIFWMKLEEITLEQKFGHVYSDYKKKVPMVLPRFWKKIKK